MSIDQYRLQPLPPTKWAFWRRFLIAVVTIFLIAVLAFSVITFGSIELFHNFLLLPFR